MNSMDWCKPTLLRLGLTHKRSFVIARCVKTLHAFFISSSRRRISLCFFFTIGLLWLAVASGALFANGNWKPEPESTGREKACILILCRNSELQQLIVTLGSFEDRRDILFLQYVLLNDVPFTSEFKEAVTKAVYPASAKFGSIPHRQWSVPRWINTTRMEEGMAAMKENGVIYGDSLSYRHMCRYNSGFFFRHPLVMKYDYYWRIEPGVRFLCNIHFDPFSFMKQRSLKYSFVIQMPEIPDTVPTLWNETLKFSATLRNSKGHLKKFQDARMRWNGCHYWSNFEIADLRWFRSPSYIDYFTHLDRAGGFYHERWGDAPVHTLATALLLDPSEVHFFDEIGYEHPPFAHLPLDEYSAQNGQCMSRKKVQESGSTVLDLYHGTCLKRWIWRWKGVKIPGTEIPVEAAAFLRTAPET